MYSQYDGCNDAAQKVQNKIVKTTKLMNVLIDLKRYTNITM